LSQHAEAAASATWAGPFKTRVNAGIALAIILLGLPAAAAVAVMGEGAVRYGALAVMLFLAPLPWTTIGALRGRPPTYPRQEIRGDTVIVRPLSPSACCYGAASCLSMALASCFMMVACALAPEPPVLLLLLSPLAALVSAWAAVPYLKALRQPAPSLVIGPSGFSYEHRAGGVPWGLIEGLSLGPTMFKPARVELTVRGPAPPLQAPFRTLRNGRIEGPLPSMITHPEDRAALDRVIQHYSGSARA
jgi:hypothetical protein